MSIPSRSQPAGVSKQATGLPHLAASLHPSTAALPLDAARQVHRALEQSGSLEALQALLLDISLPTVCSRPFLDAARILGHDAVVRLAATLLIENAEPLGLEDALVAHAQAVLALYQSAARKAPVGVMEALEASHWLRQALVLVADPSGKDLPWPGAEARAGAQADTETSTGTDAAAEMAFEFLLDQQAFRAAADLLILRWSRLGLTEHTLQLVRALLVRQGSAAPTLAHRQQWERAYTTVLQHPLPPSAEIAASVAPLWDALRLLLAESLRQGPVARVETALAWCAQVQGPRARIQAAYLSAALHCRAGRIEAAAQCLETTLSGLLAQGLDWARQVFVAPGGNQCSASFDTGAARHALQDLHAALEPHGIQPFLVSGTLLGYARQGGFLAHDKDIDLGLFSDDQGLSALQALHASGRFGIKAQGLDLCNTHNVCIWHRDTGIAIDLFLYRQESTEAGPRLVTGLRNDLGYLQTFAFRPFTLQRIRFLDIDTWAPSDIAANLEDNFGAWHTPDPGYLSHLESPSCVDAGGPVWRLVARLKWMEALLKDSASMAHRLQRLDAGMQLPNPLREQLHAVYERPEPASTAAAPLPSVSIPPSHPAPRASSLALIVLAAGQGSRMGLETPKQFLRVAGRSLLEHSIDALLQGCADLHPPPRLVVVIPAGSQALVQSLLSDHPCAEIVVGGTSRQASTAAALQHLAAQPPAQVLIHDAARPLVSAQIVLDVRSALQHHVAVDVAIPATDTILQVVDGYIRKIPARAQLWRGQTPQGFQFDALLRAYQRIAPAQWSQYTDDCGLFLAAHPQAQIWVVPGESANIKVTEDLDLVLADELFRLQARQWHPDQQGLQVRNKRALIFGGGQGIGKAMHAILEDAGCRVEVASRRDGCDIRHAPDVERAIEQAALRWGGLDFVVNTVGQLAHSDLHRQDEHTIESLVAVNLTGAFFISKASQPVLQRSHGMLLHFGSSSYTRGRAQYTPYSACKAGIVNLTQGLADEWRGQGIQVNCVVPGRTDTAMRRSQFGAEAAETLRSPYEVGLAACKVLSSGRTGMVVRV